LFVKNAVIYIFDNSDKLPFTATFDNLTVLDNTKGQFIDFNKWLEQYPKRNLSPGRTNNFASAKHCYSVDKCMELINDNFILMDSDILLKKDVSDLYDENSIYVGEIIKQPRFNVSRILPFICYINTKMCVENNIHYFDEEHMYGLNKSRESEKYDTGSSFYLNTLNFTHKEIKINDYIVHYKAGSWVDTARAIHHYKQIDYLEWLNKYKKYWSSEKNKKVVYTCITGQYDGLIEPEYVTDGYDYVCFTDNEDFSSDVWDIRPLPKEVEGLSQIKKQRFIKINPHLFLPEYELSVWVDGNVTLKGNLNELTEKTLVDDCSIYVPKHPSRNCIYSEAKAVISMRKDKEENVNPQIDRYEKEGFPSKYGLLQSNIVIRKHNNEDCKKIMETWSDEVINGSHRDQLSFNYVLWKNNDVKVIYLDKKIYKSEWFYWNSGHKKFHKKIKSETISYNNKTKSDLKDRINKNREAFRGLIRKKKMATNTVGIY
jgi:hypothetical protein